MNALKRKVGPFSLWVWLAALAAVVVVYYIYRRHQSSAGTAAGDSTILTTGVLPQDTAQAGAPPANGAPASSLSPDVASQLADIQTSLADVVSGQSDLNTTLGGQLGDLSSEFQSFASAQLSAPTAGGVNQAWTPSALHLPHRATVTKPTTKTSKAKPKKAVTRTKQTVPKRKPKPKPRVR